MISSEASALLIRKKDLLERALEITEKQSRLIGAEDVSPLVESLDERQRIFNEINVVDEALSSFMEEYRASLEFQPLLNEISMLLSKISEIDKTNNEKAASFMDELRGNMRRLNTGRIQNRLYERPSAFGASYFDQLK